MGHGPARTDASPHDLLSATHGDTTPAAPVLGDLAYAQAATTGTTDDSKFWIDGQPIDAISSENSAAGQQFWLDGVPSSSLISGATVGATTWRRLPKGANGQALVMVAGVPAWTNLSGLSTGQGARVYRSTNYTLAWGTPTAMSFDTVERDDAGFFAAGTPTRLTVSASGWYLVNGQTAADYSQAGLLEVSIRVNGSTFKNGRQIGLDNVASGWGVSYDQKGLSALVYLNAGDYIELVVTSARTALTSASMIGGAAYTNLSIVKVG